MNNQFHTACAKNFVKLSLITVAALTSTLGLRTELIVIIGDPFISTWIAILWVLTIITVLGYYKAKQDVELEVFREHERNRHILGMPPIGTNNSIYSKKDSSELKLGDAVFLKEDK